MKWEKLRIFTRPIKKIRHGSKFDYSRQTASPSVLIYPVTIEFCPANYLLTIIENSDRTAIAVLVVVCERKRRSYVQWRHQRGIWGGYATHFGNVRRTCRIFGENLTLSSEFWRKNVVIVVIYVGILIGFVGISFCRKLQPPPPHSSRSTDVTAYVCCSFQENTQLSTISSCYGWSNLTLKLVLWRRVHPSPRKLSLR